MSINRANDDEGAREALDCIQAYYNRGYEAPAEEFDWQRWLNEQFSAEELAAFNSTGTFPATAAAVSEEAYNPIDDIQRYYDRRRD